MTRITFPSRSTKNKAGNSLIIVMHKTTYSNRTNLLKLSLLSFDFCNILEWEGCFG